MTEERLRQLMQDEEGEHLEFKQSLCDWKEIGDYAVAIGNEGGGWMFMGITNTEPRKVHGIKPQSHSDLQQIRRSVWDSNSINVETELIEMSEGTVLAVKIPSRPPGLLFRTSNGRFLRRVGEDIRPMSQAEITAVTNEIGVGSSILSELKTIPKYQGMYVVPQVPMQFERREFLFMEADERTVKLAGTHHIEIPTSGISKRLWSHGELTLKLHGRLQWLTTKEQWKYFDDPVSADQRQFGIPKASALEDRRVQEIKRALEPKGYEFFFRRWAEIPTHLSNGLQLVYDDDGCFFATPEQALICRVRRG